MGEPESWVLDEAPVPGEMPAPGDVPVLGDISGLGEILVPSGVPVPVSGGAVAELRRTRLAEGRRETWLTSSAGRSLAVVTNGDRAMVMLLDGEGDAGEHAVDPGAEGAATGYVLENGQDDEHANADTVPLTDALRIATHVVEHGTPPPGTPWHTDR